MREKLYFLLKHFLIFVLSTAGLLLILFPIYMILLIGVFSFFDIIFGVDAGFDFGASMMWGPLAILILTAPFTLPIYALSIYIFQRYEFKDLYLQFFTAFIFSCSAIIFLSQWQKFDLIGACVVLIITSFGYILPITQRFLYKVVLNS